MFQKKDVVYKCWIVRVEGVGDVPIKRSDRLLTKTEAIALAQGMYPNSIIGQVHPVVLDDIDSYDLN